MPGDSWVAICLGHRLDMLRWTQDSINQNFLSSLAFQADLFIYSRWHVTIADFPVLWHRVVDVDVQVDEDAKVAALAAKEGRTWPPPLEKWSLHAKVAAEGRAWRLQHAAAGSPKVAYMHRRCLERITAFELERAGKQYAWVIWSRPDILWIGPHPALSSLEPAMCHVPVGEDNSGINDRHAICPRHLADVYLGGAWPQLWSAEAVLWCWTARRSRLLRQQDTTLPLPLELNTERWLQARLEAANLPVGRLALPAFVIKQRQREAGVFEMLAKYTSEMQHAQACLRPGAYNPWCTAALEDEISLLLAAGGEHSKATMKRISGEVTVWSDRRGANISLNASRRSGRAIVLDVLTPNQEALGGCRVQVFSGWPRGDARTLAVEPITSSANNAAPLCLATYYSQRGSCLGCPGDPYGDMWVLQVKPSCNAMHQLCDSLNASSRSLSLISWLKHHGKKLWQKSCDQREDLEALHYSFIIH
eukprot:TRINITY_DN50695_c0_g1_i1.p1 TRINITY_DN50695_c0_g1~~TRINITY_DN50695_c0_g1_i1.p1  ORF type:complete len:476 (-),score=69.81 TRINITY_DN50695_c0_g1_i1:138-1565(-)